MFRKAGKTEGHCQNYRNYDAEGLEPDIGQRSSLFPQACKGNRRANVEENDRRDPYYEVGVCGVIRSHPLGNRRAEEGYQPEKKAGPPGK